MILRGVTTIRLAFRMMKSAHLTVGIDPTLTMQSGSILMMPMFTLYRSQISVPFYHRQTLLFPVLTCCFTKGQPLHKPGRIQLHWCTCIQESLFLIIYTMSIRTFVVDSSITEIFIFAVLLWGMHVMSRVAQDRNHTSDAIQNVPKLCL